MSNEQTIWLIIAILWAGALSTCGGFGSDDKNALVGAIDRNTAAIERLADTAEAPKECAP